jgi:tetratricopeptide (TPR) repeat protein
MGRYEESISACERALELDSQNFDALNTQSLALSLLKNFDKAIISIDRAINLESKDILLQANRGIILARAGRYSEAFTVCKQSIEQHPKHEIGYYAKACYYSLKDEIDLAIDNMQKAIDIKPRLCRREAKQNPDFDNISDNLRFRDLVYRDNSV